jgi:hypothetical protein
LEKEQHMAAKIGLELKITVDDASAFLTNPALLAVLQQLNAYVTSPEYQNTFVTPQAPAAPDLSASPVTESVDEDDSELSAADLRDAALAAQVVAAKEARSAEAKSPATQPKTSTRKRAQAETPPAPVVAESLKQGDKTATIRAYVASRPEGATPKEILRYLRENFTWARESGSLANTVHTSLNNMLKRSVLAYDEQRRTYTFVSDPASRAPSKPAPVVVVFESAEDAIVLAPPTEPVAEPVVETPVEAAPAPVVFTEEELSAKAEEMRANPAPVAPLFD